MKWLLTLTLFITASALKAEVTTEHVDQMIDQMVKENVISLEEAQKAKVRMRGMSKEQWVQINTQASAIAQRSPASVELSENKIQEVNKIDLDGAQFQQIQEDLKKIVPQYKD